jgi:hypothetical protein
VRWLIQPQKRSISKRQTPLILGRVASAVQNADKLPGGPKVANLTTVCDGIESTLPTFDVTTCPAWGFDGCVPSLSNAVSRCGISRRILDRPFSTIGTLVDVNGIKERSNDEQRRVEEV